MRFLKTVLLTAMMLACHQSAEVSAQNLFDVLFGTPELNPEWTFKTGLFDEGGAEIVAFDAQTQRVFVTNGFDAAIDVLDVASGDKIGSVDVSDLGGPTSVTAFKGTIAIAVDSGETDVRGNVVFANAATLNRIDVVEVGFLPDMLTYTPDGKRVVVANEGEPNDDYTVDPEGSISIIRIRGNGTKQVIEAGFGAFDAQQSALEAAGVRIFGPGATVAQDLEPEYIAVSADSRTAYVALQENNAVAVVDLKKAEVTSILPLGYKDHSSAGNEFDASNRDGAINIQNWPTLGMYQPDSMSSMSFFGFTLLVTANEGDARDYDGFSEESRVKDLALDPTAYPDAAALQLDENLGRLNSTTATGDSDGDGDIDQIYSYGARSFSIWLVGPGGGLTQVFDSGRALEEITATLIPDDFNSTNDENGSFDNRSDDKGPEPEALTVDNDLFQSFAFIGLERVGGIMLYDVTNPFAPRFMQYRNDRDFSGDAEAGTAGDLAPEGIVFVPRGKTSFVEPVVLVANEVSGSTTLYRVNRVGGLFSFLLNGN